MKTFDEAFQKINSQYPLSENLNDCMSESLNNEKFVRLIQKLAEQYAINLTTKSKDARDVQAITCSTFQVVFELGRLVGMEMEK